MSSLPVSGQRALLLYPDGVINVNHGYVHSKENFDLDMDACKAGYRVVTVTNHLGIGRGYYTEGQFHDLTVWICAQFQKYGAFIARVYFPPYHPAQGIGKFPKDEDTRKPGPEMIPRANCELGLTFENSALIGDKQSDILAGIASGVRTNILFANDAFAKLAGLNYLTLRALNEVIPSLEGAVATLAQ